MAWFDGWLGAALEQEPEPVRAAQRVRTEADGGSCGAGRLTVSVGHRDLYAPGTLNPAPVALVLSPVSAVRGETDDDRTGAAASGATFAAVAGARSTAAVRRAVWAWAATARRCRDPRLPGVAGRHRSVPATRCTRSTPALLVLAVVIGMVTTSASAWRWSVIAGGLRLRLPLRTAIADCYRSIFLNATLPGGVLGDVHRAVNHGREVGDVGRGVRAVFWERTAGQIVQSVLALVVLLTFAVAGAVGDAGRRRGPARAAGRAGAADRGAAARWGVTVGPDPADRAVRRLGRRCSPVASARGWWSPRWSRWPGTCSRSSSPRTPPACMPGRPCWFRSRCWRWS